MTSCKLCWRVVIGLCLLCASVIIAELATSLIRGYGFFTVTRFTMSQPYHKSIRDLRKVAKYCKKHFAEIPRTAPGRWPEPTKIDENVDTVRLAESQPYKKFDIWIFESVSHHGRYLYSPLPARGHEFFFWNDPNYIGIVTMCNMAKREFPLGVYHPYKKYPKFVLDYLEGERWACWTSTPSLMPIRTDLPPVPGAIIFFTEHTGGPLKCRYEKKILPVVKTIYPNLEIPPEAILE